MSDDGDYDVDGGDFDGDDIDNDIDEAGDDVEQGDNVDILPGGTQKEILKASTKQLRLVRTLTTPMQKWENARDAALT